MAIEIEEEKTISVGALEQGVKISEMSEDMAREWVRNESLFWRDLSLEDLHIQIAGRSYRIESPSKTYANYWESILAQDEKPMFFFRLYDAINNAKALRLILSDGSIARKIVDSLHEAGYSGEGPEYVNSINVEDAHLALVCYSQEVYSDDTQGRQATQAAQLEKAMAVVRVHPGADHISSHARLDETLSLARTQETQSRDFLAKAGKELEDRLEKIQSLEETYGEKASLGGARHILGDRRP